MRLNYDLIGVLVDRELLEDGQVEQAALGLAGEVVGPLVGVDQQERLVERGHDVIDLVLGELRPLLDLGLLGGDAGLFGFQHVFGDGVAVEELDELLLLGGQLPQATGMALTLGARDLGSLLDRRADGLADVLAFFDGQPIIGVNCLQPVLDEGEPDIARPARAVRRHPAEAGVVLVVGTEFAAMAAVAMALAAAAADDLAGQVVVMLAAAAAAGPVAGEDSLDAIEGGLVNEFFVTSAPLGVAVGDDAEVVVAAQQAMHGRGGQRLGRSRRRRPSAQSGFREDLGDGADGVLAGRGQIEGHPDQRRPLGIDRHAGNLAVLDRFADVEVAQSGRAERAALQVLALLAEADLLAVVARAEGVDAAHDGELQHAFGRVVDALLGRFELGAVGGDLAQQPEGVKLVAGATAEVIEDDVVGLQLGQLAEHLLQLGAVAGRGRLAGLDVLADDARAEALGMRGADVALGR